MKINRNLINILRAGGFGLAVFGAIGFAERKYDQKQLNEVSVVIDNQYDNYFLDEEEIKTVVKDSDTGSIMGAVLDDLNLRLIETKLRGHKFVEQAQVYHDHKGRLTVRLNQSKPIARLSRPEKPDAYIGSEGQILPTSEAFTARVLVVTGHFTDSLAQGDLTHTSKGRSFLQLLHYIEADPFWKAQIAQIEIDRIGDITLYPQLSKQYVEFGQAEDIPEKFRKMMIFYKQILPEKGWNTYEKVNIKYENQIICE